jgi:hypothetical protein
MSKLSDLPQNFTTHQKTSSMLNCIKIYLNLFFSSFFLHNPYFLGRQSNNHCLKFPEYSFFAGKNSLAADKFQQKSIALLFFVARLLSSLVCLDPLSWEFLRVRKRERNFRFCVFLNDF